MGASELLTDLLDYVLEQDKDIDPRGFKLQAHKGFLKGLQDLQALPGVDFDLKVDGDHVWMRVARLDAKAPPALPAEQWKGIVVVDVDPEGTAPRLNEGELKRCIAADSKGKLDEDRTAIEQRWRDGASQVLEQYTELWRAWAAGEAPRRKTIQLYGDLFAIKQQLEAEQTANPQELVWGLGVSAWKLSYEARGTAVPIDFQYPLLTQAMELALDDSTLAVEVRPRSIEPRFQFDAFSACLVPTAVDVERSAREALAKSADRPVSPFDPGSYEHLLKLIAGNLHDKGRFVNGQQGYPAPTEELVVSDAWVLLTRPRTNNFLHEDIERLKSRVEAGDPIPAGPKAIVTPPSDAPLVHEPVSYRGRSGCVVTSGATGEPLELYFPLPYNQEQVTIVEQLERSDGVAVQGPPGTGKTHTIANIICHFLATGRKVLVTSKGEQALEVLQSKIPEAVRPLTVALLAGDREGMRQFQSSIEAILHNVSQLNVEDVREQIENMRGAIERAHEELAGVDRRVDDIAQTQLSEVEVDGIAMRAQKMAEMVLHGAEQHAWFDDDITLDKSHAPPLSGEEAARLRESRRSLGEDLVYAAARTPSSAGLLSADEVRMVHEALVDMRSIEASEEAGGLLSLRATTQETLEEARGMLELVEQAHTLAAELESSGDAWPGELRKRCLQPAFASERAALEALFGEVAALVEARAEFLKRPVDMPEEAFGSSKVLEALERGAQSGKPFGLMSFGGGPTKEQVAAIRVSGLAPANAEDWKHVLRYAQLHARVHSFSVRWNQFAELLSVPKVQGSVLALRAIELQSTLALKAHRMASHFDERLAAMAERVFARPPLAEVRGSAAQLSEVRQHLRSHLTRADLARATSSLATLQEKLSGTSGPVSEELRVFVETELGSDDVPVDRAVARYAELVSEVRRIEALAHDLSVVTELAGRVERAGGVKLGLRLRTLPLSATGEDKALPASWREAWTWARVKSHLDGIEAREELRMLAARRRDLEAGLARLYEELVAKSAWLSTKLTATPAVLSALESYRASVRRIGMGTGPNATRHRRNAQKAMHDAQGAVPCWVMSHAKVSETLPSKLGTFDLVIVDEASQSDLWALPAVLRGKKILVVGDDKQVSPEGGFISAARIQELQDRFLAEQPHKQALTPENSLYDLASRVFSAQKVMLREHFRCVPPIIAYSNRFYDGFIQPLRLPKASERLDPPLVDIYVPTGLRGVKDENRREAQAIAAEIEAIVLDPKFAGRTLGVVSLLGPDQAKHIDTLVRSRIDAMELKKRDFKCGDARLFQGSERDIIFLSMVVDAKNCKAVSGNMFEQRFNVAASRARDRLYLVRSVQLTDLSPADGLRRGLLGHFTKPLDGSVEEAKSLIAECESGFERDVYGELFERGYHVIPQVKAGAYRIDMVVEGANDSRLALECDGDEYHGPDRWPRDMARQRVLERAGWTFWRCFASTWAMRREEVLSELLERLTAMGIEPIGATARTPALVESRVWPPGEPSRSAPDAVQAVLEDAIAAAK